MVTRPSTNAAVHGQESKLWHVDHKSGCPNHYTTKPPGKDTEPHYSLGWIFADDK